MRKKILGTAIGLLISILSIWLIAKQVDFKASFVAISALPTWFAFLLPLLYLLTTPLRALRWKLMMAKYRLPLVDFLKGIILGFAGNNLLPARGGELIRMRHFHITARSGNVTAIFSILAEKIIDGLTLLFLMVLSFWGLQQLISDAAWAEQVALSAGLIFVVSLLGVLFIRVYGLSMIGWLRAKPHKLARWSAQFILKLLNALVFLKWNSRMLGIVALSVAIWLLEGAMFMLIIEHLEPKSNYFLIGLFALAIVNFGLVVPSSPGYIGVFQGLTILALGLVGIDSQKALTVGLVVHLFQFLPITIWGVAWLMLSPGNLFKWKAAAPANQLP